MGQKMFATGSPAFLLPFESFPEKVVVKGKRQVTRTQSKCLKATLSSGWACDVQGCRYPISLRDDYGHRISNTTLNLGWLPVIICRPRTIQPLASQERPNPLWDSSLGTHNQHHHRSMVFENSKCVYLKEQLVRQRPPSEAPPVQPRSEGAGWDLS